MNTVLFDLDGTLLPMEQDSFVRAYLHELGLKGIALGFGAQELVRTVLSGVEAMLTNAGDLTNEEVFWELFIDVFGGKPDHYVKEFEEFYNNEFARVAKVVQPTPLANQTVQLLKAKGYDLALATNPIFPRVATLERMRWAGLDPQDFTLITTYENSRFTKPNLDYYRNILEILAVEPEECLMIGNDVEEDLCAAELGMQVFLVTDDLINPQGADISHFSSGDRHALVSYVEGLPPLVTA